MRFGCCVGPAQAAAAAAAGGEFLELPTGALTPEQPEDEFRTLREGLLASPAPAEVWRLSLPESARWHSPEPDWAAVSRSVYTVARRAGACGGSLLVCGRELCQAPAGVSADQARERLLELARLCVEMAEPQGMVVALEPAPEAECAALASLAEAADMARALGAGRAGVVADAGSLARAEHSPLDVVDLAEWLAHVRMWAADCAPESARAEWLAEFCAALEMADYEWRVAITLADGGAPRSVRQALTSAREFIERALTRTHSRYG